LTNHFQAGVTCVTHVDTQNIIPRTCHIWNIV